MTKDEYQALMTELRNIRLAVQDLRLTVEIIAELLPVDGQDATEDDTERRTDDAEGDEFHG